MHIYFKLCYHDPIESFEKRICRNISAMYSLDGASGTEPQTVRNSGIEGMARQRRMFHPYRQIPHRIW